MMLDKRIISWLQLLRVPNLPSVPGDPIAGFALASLGQSDVNWIRVLPAVGCSLLLYATGMIWNDCADYKEDLEHRPLRPLPSGSISRRTALIVGCVLAIAAVSLAAVAGMTTFVVALVLLGLVFAYNFVSRRLRWLGIVNMGACRGVSVLLGATSALASYQWTLVVIMAAVGIMLYIMAVSWIAIDELKGSFLSKHVGLMIRLLIVIQAVLCVFGTSGGMWLAGVVLMGWPVSWWLGKQFYAS